jgi:hypothetical protein
MKSMRKIGWRTINNKNTELGQEKSQKIILNGQKILTTKERKLQEYKNRKKEKEKKKILGNLEILQNKNLNKNKIQKNASSQFRRVTSIRKQNMAHFSGNI